MNVRIAALAAALGCAVLAGCSPGQSVNPPSGAVTSTTPEPPAPTTPPQIAAPRPSETAPEQSSPVTGAPRTGENRTDETRTDEPVTDAPVTEHEHEPENGAATDPTTEPYDHEVEGRLCYNCPDPEQLGSDGTEKRTGGATVEDCRPPMTERGAADYADDALGFAAECLGTGSAADPVSPSGSTYTNCVQVRAAGAAPIHRGQPGYSTDLDRDGDGVACYK
ncbi:excalibur calcium-binding domain-containing protein [Rhodococcus kronopolitis]|uniref:Excalibur calcium-binding domain-containing protein n=1 Tax=Rhodococcus kronopolitis TaxID=1460226 RepID=A0ABV9FPI5_9NOCA